MKFEDGKYEVVFDENNIPREVLRYGEPWRDILCDKFLATVFLELKELREYKLVYEGVWLNE